MKAQITIEQIDYIKQHFATTPSKQLALQLGLKYSTINHFAYKFGLKKHPDYIKELLKIEAEKLKVRGMPGRFAKGHVPANKGKEMCAEVYEKISKTFFKKGHKPHNTKFDGYMSIRKDKKSGRAYIYTRVHEGKFRELHRIIWEQHNGSIPNGYNVVFKDNNSANINITNLELVSNAELMKRNTIQRFPGELKQLIRLISKLNKEIKNNGEK